MKRQGELLEAEEREAKRPALAPMPEFFAQLLPEMTEEIFGADVVTRRLVATLCKANLRAMEPELYAYTLGEQRAEPGPTARYRQRLLELPAHCSFAYRLAREADTRVFNDRATTSYLDVARLAMTRNGGGGVEVSLIRYYLRGAAAGGHADRVRDILVATRGLAAMVACPLAYPLGRRVSMDDQKLAVLVEREVLTTSVITGRDSDADLDRLITAIGAGFGRDSPPWRRDAERQYELALSLIRSGWATDVLKFIERTLGGLSMCPADVHHLFAVAFAARYSSALLESLVPKYAEFQQTLNSLGSLADLRSAEVVQQTGVIFRLSVDTLAWLRARGLCTLGGDCNTRCREWVACTDDDPTGKKALALLRSDFGATDAQCL